jgi:predicted HicB family RNase H-like nuclease
MIASTAGTAMGTMEYEDFTAEISFNSSAKRFDAVVINAEQEIEFTGMSVAELEANFKLCIDRYVASCKSNGVDPYKTFSGMHALRFTSTTIHRECAGAALKEGMSLNKWIEVACKEKLNKGSLERNA